MAAMSGTVGQGFVLAAVDASPDRDRALRFAVAEAQLRRRPLRLVHVPADPPPLLALGAMVPVYDTEVLEQTSRAILEETITVARELAGDDVEIEGVIQHGARTGAILEAAEGAELIVLATRSSQLRRILTGSTTAGVAGRAEQPVVCVPASWEEVHHDRIIAAVDGSAATESILRAAVAISEQRRCRLTVLHAWQPHPAYADIIEAQRESGAWQRDSERMLAELTVGVRADHPDTEFDLVGLFEPTAEALVDASATADLMVVGRRGQGSPFGLSLGSISRTMITHAHCPVMVVPPAPQE